MQKRIMAFVIAGLVILTFAGCSNTTVVKNSSKISVVVSFNPLREFAQRIGGDKIDISVVVPAGTEPHDFEPKARDLMNINEAKIFVYNGLGMESWIDQVKSTVDNKKIIIVDASKGCNLISNSNAVDVHGQYDPHIWLSLREAKRESYNIMEALVKADPKNKAFYSKNYDAFKSELDKIYNDNIKRFAALKNKNFVTGHAAFAYLCRDFGIKQNSVEDVFAEGEPSAKKLKNLVDYCRANNIKTIFMESMVSPRISETLASEIGAKVEKIYTIESKEDNKDYIESMEANLDKIYKSLSSM